MYFVSNWCHRLLNCFAIFAILQTPPILLSVFGGSFFYTSFTPGTTCRVCFCHVHRIIKHWGQWTYSLWWDTLTCSRKAKSLLGCCLYIYPANFDIKRFCYIFPHSVNIIPKFRTLCYHGRINIFYNITLLIKKLSNLTKKFYAWYSLCLLYTSPSPRD